MNFRISFSGILTASVIGMMALTSCGDITQDLRLNADGSGTLESTFDLGEFLALMKGFEGMGNAGGTENFEGVEIEEVEEVEPVEEAEPVDPMEAFMQKITDPEYAIDVDTMFSLFDIMPDSVKALQTRPDLAEKIKVRIKSPANSEALTIGMITAFDHVAQLREITEYLQTFRDNPPSGSISDSGMNDFLYNSFVAFEADTKAGWIRIDSVDYLAFAESMGMFGGEGGGDETGMLEMMFGGTKIKSVIHVPGEVTSCTHPDALLTKDNKVIVEHSMVDVLKKGKTPGYTIYFKPGQGK